MENRVLIVDDDQSMCEMVEADLRARGLDASWTTRADQALERLKGEEYDVVLTDLKMPDMDGIELCRRIADLRPDVPVVVITAFGSLDTAVASIRAGAFDFVTKPLELDLLALTLERALKHRGLHKQIKMLSLAAEQERHFDDLLGSSPPMQKLYDQLGRIAETDSTVLLTGESGTGKELVAKALHRRSARSKAPFVAVNCTALPATLLESELFGHRGGAFTGAQTHRKGLFLQAGKGTLFLDEIGDFPLELQPKLLRALEQRIFRPLGSDEEVRLEARIIVATNRDLDSAVEEGRFRRDLYFRINVIQVPLPPLRARGTDILLLAQHFLEMFAKDNDKPVKGISKPLAEKLLDYDWPGNVRELKNAMERAVALTRFNQLAVEDLPEKIRDYQGGPVTVGGNNPEELVSMEEVERRYILHVIKVVRDNKSLASKILGFDRKTLYRKLERYGLAGEG